MTEAAKRRRLSRGALRALAWIAGGATFASSFASLTVSPRPATAADTARPRRVVIVKKITRRVIVREAPDTSPRYVYVGGGSSGSSSGPSGGSTVSASAPSSTTSSGGS
ncbi:MAG TPA: hypothetical protein VFZ96_03175 [Actinomycetota bacterium]|nr:hypothetical protein [Actinomycetota bacterium]